MDPEIDEIDDFLTIILSVQNLPQICAASPKVYLSRCSTDLRSILGHSVHSDSWCILACVCFLFGLKGLMKLSRGPVTSNSLRSPRFNPINAGVFHILSLVGEGS